MKPLVSAAEIAHKIIKKLGVDMFPGRLNKFQREMYRSGARHQVCIWGRRGGKTWYGAWRNTLNSLGAKPWSISYVVSPTENLVTVCWQKYLQIVPSKYIYRIKSSAGKREIILLNGSNSLGKQYNGTVIKFRSAEGRGLIGEGPCSVHLDEAALIPSEVWKMELRPALWECEAPTTWTTTPRGVSNHTYELYQKGLAKEDGFFASRYPSFANPLLSQKGPKEYIAICRDIDKFSSKKALMALWEAYFAGRDIYTMPELKELDPLVQQEIFAAFVATGGAVFQNLDNCVCDHPIKTVDPGDKFYCGVDVAKEEDYTVALWLRENGELYPDYVRVQHLSYRKQAEIIIGKAKQYNNSPILMDATGVGAAVMSIFMEEAQGTGVEIYGKKFNEAARRVVDPRIAPNTSFKDWMMDELRVAIEASAIKIPQELTFLTDEMQAMECKQTASGKYTYKSKVHDDSVMSLGLANVLKSRYGKSGFVLGVVDLYE